MRIEFQARVPGRRKFRSAQAAAAVLALLAAVFVSGHRLITPGFLLSANELNFTGVQAGVETPAQYVQLTNPFTADLRLDSVTLRGEAGAYRYLWNSCVGKAIHPKEACQIGVSFVPPVVGTEKATLEVASINGDRRTVRLTGLLNPAAVLRAPATPEVNPPVPRPADNTSPDAGNSVVVGPTVAPPPPTQITPPTPTPPQPVPTPTPRQPAPTPTPPQPVPTPKPAPTPTPPVPIPTPKPTPPPTPPRPQTPPPPVIGASLRPNPVRFPAVTVGALSVGDVTVTNTGDAPFPAGQATIEGDHWNDFRIVNDPCSTRAIASSCTIRVVFLPSEAGQHRAELSLPGGGARYSVWLDGTATPPPVPIADLQPLSVDLTQMVPERPIELRNIGNGSLTVTGISLGGRNPDDFTLETRNCANAAIGRNQGCTMEVIFRADNARRGRHKVSEAVVTLQDNAEGSPRSVMVTGTLAANDPTSVALPPAPPPYVFRPIPPNPRKQVPTPVPPTTGNSSPREPVPPPQKPRQAAPTPAPTGNSDTRQPALPSRKPPVTTRQADRPKPATIQ